MGLFVDRDALFNTRHRGLFRSGSFELLGAQVAAVVVIMAWSALMSYLVLKSVLYFMPIRVDLETEDAGLDMSLNKINTDYDWDKILSPNPDPTVEQATATKRQTRQRLAAVINAIIAVNRLMQSSSQSRIRHQLKAYNTKVLAQSWSSVRPLHTSARVRPQHAQPHA